MQLPMDDDFMRGFRDPYDRLEEIESGLLNHAQHIEQITEQLKINSQLSEKITDNFRELARANWHLFQLVQQLQQRIDQLEGTDEN